MCGSFKDNNMSLMNSICRLRKVPGEEVEPTRSDDTVRGPKEVGQTSTMTKDYK